MSFCAWFSLASGHYRIRTVAWGLVKKEPPGNWQGPWPSDCFDSCFAPSTLGRQPPGGAFLPGINGRPASGFHPHQSNGEVHYLRHTQVGLSEFGEAISQEKGAVKLYFLINF
jgi:hypothetical protein